MILMFSCDWLSLPLKPTIYLIWFNSSGHNSSKLPAPHKTVHIKWVAPNSLSKSVSLGRFCYQYFGVDSIRLYWLWASFGASFQFKLQHLCLWNRFGWRQLAHLKQAPENKRKPQERVFQSPMRRDPMHKEFFCFNLFLSSMSWVTKDTACSKGINAVRFKLLCYRMQADLLVHL